MYFRLVTENANGASNGTVKKFVPHAVIDLSTKPATNVAPRSATLNGSFLGNGDGTEYFFEYGHGPPGVYSESTPTQDAGEPGGATPLSAPVSNSLLETTYHYRVVAVNGTGTSKGFDESFTTPSAVAGLTTEAASDIGQETITLNGKFTGDGHDTKYFFEYGPTKSLRPGQQRRPVRCRDHLRHDVRLDRDLQLLRLLDATTTGWSPKMSSAPPTAKT